MVLLLELPSAWISQDALRSPLAIEEARETSSQVIVQSFFQQMGTWLEKSLGSLL